MRQKLGQHFLKSKSIAKTLIDAAETGSRETVVEIGPGKGFLTELLLERNINLIAIEKDPNLIEFLKEKFKEDIKKRKLILIEGDARDMNWMGELKNKSFKIIANIPYYLTGLIIRKLLENENQPKCISLLVQKEIGERIARDKKESILSLSVKFFSDVKYIKTVPASFFNPKPKVSSSIILIKNIRKRENKEMFFEIIHKAFSQKRKTIKNNLSEYPSILEKFKKLGIDENMRAEDISYDNWLKVIY